jgi:hypothetical protein
MRRPQAVVGRLYLRKKKRVRGLLGIEVTYKAEIINIGKYLNTKYKADKFVNIFKSHDSNQPNIYLTNK